MSPHPALARRVGLSHAVVQHGIDAFNLAETVAAELKERGHESEAPLPDVKGRTAKMVDARLTVGHDHLREWESVGRAHALAADR